LIEFRRLGTTVIKLFTVVIHKWAKKLECFSPARPFKPVLMFAGTAGAYPSEASVRIGWKSLPGTNTADVFVLGMTFQPSLMLRLRPYSKTLD